MTVYPSFDDQPAANDSAMDHPVESELASESSAAPPDLIELVQFYALRQDPLTLTIESETVQRGWVAVDEGDVVRATTAGGKEGFDAFVEIVSWERPTVVKLDPGETAEPNIELPIAQLLLETFWEAQEHQPTDPEQPPVPAGLEEDTVARQTEFGPPDGVTKEVLETAQWFSGLAGFVAVALISSADGETVETLGKRSRLEIPGWLGRAAHELADDPDFEKSVIMSTDFIDVLLPPRSDTEIAYLLRMDRRATNRGLVEVALQNAPM